MKQREGQRPRLLTAGYVTLDLIVKDLATRDFWHSAGGTCGNVSIFAAALGVDVSLLGRVGKDRRGHRLVSDLVSAGVNIADVESVPALCTPGIAEIIQCTPEGTHRFTHRCPSCGTRLPKQTVVSKRKADTVAQGIDQFDGFFFDRATPATLWLAAAARGADLLVLFEPQSVPRTALAIHAAELSDIVKFSSLPGRRGKHWDLSSKGSTRFVIETLGASGARFRTRSPRGWDEWTEMPAVPPTRIRDTAGAGDWMTAGLLTSLLPQRDVNDPEPMAAAIEFGQRLSSISIAFDGPQGALTALGASTIQRAASSAGPFRAPCYADVCLSPEANCTETPSHCCELCFTERS